MDIGDRTARLVVDVEARYLGFKGLRELLSLWNRPAQASRAFALEQQGMASKVSRAYTRAKLETERNERALTRTLDREAKLRITIAEAETKGRLVALRKYAIDSKAIERDLALYRDRLARSSGVMGMTGPRVQAGYDAAARRAAFRASAVAVADRAAGLGIGAAGLGLVGGGWALSRAAGWKSYVAQQLSNSPLPGNQGNAFPRWALNMAAQTGASPKDIMLSLRYSSERLSTPGRPNTGLIRSYQRYANMLGLPTGGSESVPGIMQGMTAVAKNFPQWAKQPGAIARMLLSAGQRMPGTTIPEFVQSIPNLLVMAGHIHRKDALPQMLGLASTLGQAGYNTGEMETQLKNLFAKVIKPSAGTTKFVDWVKKTQGIDLSGDFSMEGLQKMGIKGWLADLHSKLPMNADRSRVLSRLFPNMRGFFGALALTGNLYGPAQQNTADIMRAPGTAGTREDALARNYRRYLGLTSTQAARLQQNFNRLVITMGTALIPAGNRLLKILIPLAKNADTWTAHNKKLLVGIVNILPKVLLFSLGLKGLLIMGSLGGKALTLGRGLMAAGKWVVAFRSALTGGSGLIEAFKLASGRAKTTAKEVGAVSDALAGSGAASLETAAGAAIGTETTGLKGLRTGIRGLGLAVGEALPEIAAFIILLDKFQKNGTDPGKWARDLANNFLDSPLDPYLHRLGIPTLKDIAQMIPGVRGALSSPTSSSAPRTQGVYIGPNWSGPASTVPHGTGRSFGSSFSYVTSSIPVKYVPAWYAKTFGVPASKIYDTDFSSGGMTNKPYEIPGTGQGKPWTFVRYQPDKYNPGQMIAIWRTPQGHLMAFNHTDPRGINRNGLWTKLLPGDTLRGGQMAGVSMADHLSIDTTPASRRDIMIQTGMGHLKYVPAPTGQGRQGHGSGIRGLLVPPSEMPYVGAFRQSGLAHHVDPAILASLSTSEGYSNPAWGKANPYGYGSMGVKVSRYGYGAKGQISGAGEMFQYWLDWAKSPAGKQSRYAHRDVLAQYGYKNWNSNPAILFEAAGAYANGIYWWTYFPNTTQFGPGYAQKLLKNATKYNQGHLPSTYYTGKGPNRVPTTTPSGSGNGGVTDKGYGDKNTRPTTPAEWESWYSTMSSNIEQTMQEQGYLTTPLNKLGPAKRAAFRRLILRDINKRHGARLAHIRVTVPPGPLRDELIKEADSDYAQSKAHPFRFAHHYLDSAVSRRNRRTKWEQHLGGTIFSEKGGLRELESSWTGINVRSLPKHGKGMYTQDNWLRYQIKRHALERQVADNTAKLYAAVHHEPKGWLPKILAQNKQTEKNADKRSKEYLRRIHKKSGAGSDIMPVQVVGQCAEYRAQNEYHKKHVKHGKSIADSSRGTETHTGNISRKMDTLISINREIAKGHKRAARGGGKLSARNHASSDPHLSGGTFHHDVMMT